MNCHRQRVRSAVFFGIGLLVATILPPNWVLIAAAAALVIVSISCMGR